MSLAVKVLIGLVAGLALGLAIASSGSPALASVVPFLEPVGQLWVAAIRMTIIPLVVSSLIVGVGSTPDPRSVGRIGARALVLFIAFLSVGALVAVVAGPPVLRLLPIDPSAAEALRTSAAQSGGAAVEGAKKIPSAGQFLVDLIPVNPVKAAADGAMLPLIIFSLAFGVALIRIPAERREAVLRVTEGIQDASLWLVRAVLDLAPIGVFGLAVAVAAKLGLAAAGALATYVVVVCGTAVVYAALVLYPAAVLFGGISLRAFARGVFPAQVVAFSSRSSLAALPAMLESARDRLRLPTPITAFLLPLAATTFRAGGGIGQCIGAIFVARLYGIELGPSQLAIIAITAVATTFSIPGIPGGSIIVMVPVLMAAGIPPAGVGLLLGVDTIPDMFRTTTNITGDMAAAVILARHGGVDDSPRAATAAGAPS
jgi:Na+/H+-dicarboxylate symporter